MKPIGRIEELVYFSGFVGKDTQVFWERAFRRFVASYGTEPTTRDIFEVAPFNDTLKQLIHGYRVHSSGKKGDLESYLTRALSAFFHLTSDFVPPCCGDGLGIYVIDELKNCLVCCDRCDRLYSLDGKEVCTSDFRRMAFTDFEEHCGDVIESSWPYHAELFAASALQLPIKRG